MVSAACFNASSITQSGALTHRLRPALGPSRQSSSVAPGTCSYSCTSPCLAAGQLPLLSSKAVVAWEIALFAGKTGLLARLARLRVPAGAPPAGGRAAGDGAGPALAGAGDPGGGAPGRFRTRQSLGRCSVPVD